MLSIITKAYEGGWKGEGNKEERAGRVGESRRKESLKDTLPSFFSQR